MARDIRRLLATCGPLLAALTLLGCHQEADFSDHVQIETLNADEYRSEIVAIDGLVFREAPLGADGPRLLGDELSRLARRVGARSRTKITTVEALELQLLARRAARLSPGATGARLRDDWMRVRSNLFDDREWFARSADDLDAPGREPTPAPRKIAPGS